MAGAKPQGVLEQPTSTVGRAKRGLGFVAAGVACWGLLLGGGAALLILKSAERAAARRPLPVPRTSIGPRQEFAWAHFPSFRDRIPALAYHGIDSPTKELTITQARFAKEMRALHEAGFHTVTIKQYVHFVETGSTAGLPSDPILLTFDDGRLDSYQGADRILAKYHFNAVMFVVAAWPDKRKDWGLDWEELAQMQENGRWEIQEHAGTGHHHIPVTASGRKGEYYAYRMWKDGGLESFAEYKKRVSRDVKWGERVLEERIPNYRPVAFAIPYSNYGLRHTNDPRIARFFLPFLHSRFAVVFSGDYLDEERNRWSRQLSYRITQSAGVSLQELHCRLDDFARGVAIWHEYQCLKFNERGDASVRSE